MPLLLGFLSLRVYHHPRPPLWPFVGPFDITIYYYPYVNDRLFITNCRGLFVLLFRCTVDHPADEERIFLFHFVCLFVCLLAVDDDDGYTPLPACHTGPLYCWHTHTLVDSTCRQLCYLILHKPSGGGVVQRMKE